MSVEITTSTVTLQPLSHRHFQRDPVTGNLWWRDVVSSNSVFWRSTDDGATWDEIATLELAQAGRLVICQTTGRVFFVSHTDTTVRTLIGSETSWTTVTTSAGDFGDLFVCADVIERPTGGWWLVIWYNVTSTGNSIRRALRIPSTPTSATQVGIGDTAPNRNPVLSAAIAPNGDIYELQQASSAVRFFRRPATWDSPDFTYGSATQLSTQTATATADTSSVAATEDRVAASYKTSSTAWRVREYDTSTEVTSSRDPQTNSAVGQIGYDSNGNLIIPASGSSGKRLNLFNRSNATWGGWVAIDATSAVRSICVATDNPPNRALTVWRRSSGNSIRFQDVAYNNAPTKPNWITSDGVADADEALPLIAQFTDPEFPVDVLSAFALERVVDGGSPEFWSELTSTWSGSEVKNDYASGSNGHFTVTIPASWGTNGEVHEFRIKTWDTLGDLESPWSDVLTITATAAVHPSIDSPSDGAIIPTSTATLAWTVAEQSAYRVRALDGTTVVYDSGTVADTEREADIPGLVNGRTYTLELTTRNTAGVWSNADTVDVTVVYTLPALPQIDIAPVAANLVATLTHPAPPNVVRFTGDPGNQVSTGDHASLDLTGDMDLLVFVRLPDYVTANQYLISKVDGSDLQEGGGYGLLIAPFGGQARIGFRMSDGTAFRVADSAQFTPSPNAGYWFRARYDDTAKTTAFYMDLRPSNTPLSEMADPGEWTHISTSSAHAGGSPAANSVDVWLGDRNGGGIEVTGDLYRAVIVDGHLDDAGTVVGDFRAADGDDPYVDSAGRSWALVGSEVGYVASPVVTVVDPFIRIAPGGRSDGTIPVGGNGVRFAAQSDPDSTITYRAPASGTVYQMRFRLQGDNGGVRDTDWLED